MIDKEVLEEVYKEQLSQPQRDNVGDEKTVSREPLPVLGMFTTASLDIASGRLLMHLLKESTLQLDGSSDGPENKIRKRPNLRSNPPTAKPT